MKTSRKDFCHPSIGSYLHNGNMQETLIHLSLGCGYLSDSSLSYIVPVRFPQLRRPANTVVKCPQRSTSPSSMSSLREHGNEIYIGSVPIERTLTPRLGKGTFASPIDVQFNVEDSVSTQLLVFLANVPRLGARNTMPKFSVHKFTGTASQLQQDSDYVSMR
ncbi:uncharacterized protein EV420DRAFT_151881 [Desarmillaria tabescens]|uniref:Uncharacterized protein n=1 Tax=Armillaria tabescens TaxID=1929756 RepID=A0AA39J8T7_ARMTA|nr:uncharacterized protein EV420DRAFT_151881 [Desarmillaria tabescens]KAK0438158.1 hypothetical protein EV420DRAFT_151881 [Desarmillaria tabescens]